MKYWGINLNKEAKDQYTETCNTRVKETEVDTNGKIPHVNGLEESILLKCPHSLKSSID